MHRCWLRSLRVTTPPPTREEEPARLSTSLFDVPSVRTRPGDYESVLCSHGVADPIIELVLRHLPSSLNAIDARGQTPLHIATSLARTDVVALLLNQPKIDDMIRDSNGRTCREVGGAEVAGLISGGCHGTPIRQVMLMVYLQPLVRNTTSRTFDFSRPTVRLRSKLPPPPLPLPPPSPHLPPRLSQPHLDTSPTPPPRSSTT